MLDPELLERATDLGEAIAVDLAAGLGGEKVMPAAVGIEAHRQAMLAEHLLQRPESRGRAFLLDQKRRIDLAGRVIERHDQIEQRLALEPGVARAVLMQHHPRQRTTLALPPMRSLARRLPNHALPLKMQLGPGVAPPKAVILHQMLVEVLDGEARVALAIKPLHLLRPVHRDPPARSLAEPPIDKAGFALLLVAARPSPKRPNVDPKQLGRLLLIELRRFPAVQNIQEYRHAHTLKGFRPAHPTPSKKGADLPDRSCAT